MNHHPTTSVIARTWRALTVLAVVPAVIHLLVLALAIVGFTWPAIWISEHIFDGRLAILSLWLCTIGGPLFTIIMGLTLEAWHERTRMVARVSGGFAWLLLIIGCFSSLPAAFLLAMD